MGAFRAIWNRQLGKIKDGARLLLPELQKLRKRIDPGRSETGARLRAPLLKELMQQNEMGGSDWCDQFAPGFPMWGELGEPRVYPLSSESSGIFSGEEPSKSASSRFVAARKGQGPKAEEPWREAISQTKTNWLQGPRRYAPTGELRAGGDIVVANPAFPLGAQQVGKLRAGDDLKRSPRNEAASSKTPIGFSLRITSLECVCCLIQKGKYAR